MTYRYYPLYTKTNITRYAYGIKCLASYYAWESVADMSSTRESTSLYGFSKNYIKIIRLLFFMSVILRSKQKQSSQQSKIMKSYFLIMYLLHIFLVLTRENSYTQPEKFQKFWKPNVLVVLKAKYDIQAYKTQKTVSLPLFLCRITGIFSVSFWWFSHQL